MKRERCANGNFSMEKNRRGGVSEVTQIRLQFLEDLLNIMNEGSNMQGERHLAN
jgi:hypothetical protein